MLTRRRIERAGEAADAEEDKLAVPGFRKLDTEPGRVWPRAVAVRGDRSLDDATSREGSFRRGRLCRGDGEAWNPERGQRFGGACLSGIGGEGCSHSEAKQGEGGGRAAGCPRHRFL